MKLSRVCGQTVALNSGMLTLIRYLSVAPKESSFPSSPRKYGVAPEVLQRKLDNLRQILRDLEPYAAASVAEVYAEHYKLERLLELLVVVATDSLNHLLAEEGITPTSYRDSFHLAALQGWLPADLTQRLQEAAGMRNIIVHLYERIDYAILRESIAPALRDFKQFVALLESRLDDE